MNPPVPGCSRDELDTPTLCVDIDVMHKNVESLMASCRRYGVGWRPHTKCHKSPQLAHDLLRAGALGVTCAKLGEAEVMAADGISDILIANMIVGPQKMERLVRLRRTADPVVCVDHADQISELGRAFAESQQPLRVIIEVDIGLKRVGCQPGAAVLDLAERISSTGGLQFAGIMGYEGHLLRIPDLREKAESISAALTVLTDQRHALEEAGYPCGIVSCGGTGSFVHSVKHAGITELQAGGGIFMDAFYRHACQVDQWDYALTVLATVVSRPAPDRAIIDAGRKTMDGHHHTPLVLNRAGIEVQSLSAEHGTLRLAPEAQDLRIGDRLTIVPGYSDMTCVLHDYLCGLRGGRVEVVWPIVGRGRLQ